MYVCVCTSVLLTCLGILCRHIDEVQSTWRQCRGKGCPELWVSWAMSWKNEITGFSSSSNKVQSVSLFCFQFSKQKLNVISLNIEMVSKDKGDVGDFIFGYKTNKNKTENINIVLSNNKQSSS